MVTYSAKIVLFCSNWPNIGHLENPDCIFIRNYGKFLGFISLCEQVRKRQQKHTENTTKVHRENPLILKMRRLFSMFGHLAVPRPKPKMKIGRNFRPILKITETIES